VRRRKGKTEQAIERVSEGENYRDSYFTFHIMSAFSLGDSITKLKIITKPFHFPFQPFTTSFKPFREDSVFSNGNILRSDSFN